MSDPWESFGWSADLTSPASVPTSPPAASGVVLERPEPRMPPAERVRRWAVAVGPGRIAVWAACGVLVLLGGWWLVRPPAPPIEDSLPLAAGEPSSVAEPTQTAPTERLVVHVAGAVRRPGVYRFTGGARVADAIERAGGAGRHADLDGINLAAPLVDGQQVKVPRDGEVVETPGADAPSGPVDLNNATVEQLDALPGVGPATASAIVRHREDNGPFATVDDLLDVPGIGPAKLDALRGAVTT